MENSAKTPQKKESKHFWGFPFTHFTYFFMWQIIFGYLTLWMEQVGHMNGAEAGVVFSAMAGLSLLFQPAFGVISDKLLFKKNLLFTIAIAAMLIGPYFQWVFMPLMHINSMLVAIVTGIYLCFIFNGGVSVIEQYVQRASLANGFEYGHSRMGGSLAGMVASFVGGQIFLWHPNSIFWACTISATILTGLLLFSDKVDMDNASAAGDTSNSLDLSMIGKIFKLKNFWYLSIFYIGTSAIYDVFDQQFIIFLRLLAGFEMPLVLVSIMKYIAGAFDVRVYATVYALASNFAKQISVFIFSAFAGSMYDSIGFHHTYLILGAIVAVVTIFAALVLKKENPVQAGERDEAGKPKA